jgi:translation initiation factor IF-1
MEKLIAGYLLEFDGFVENFSKDKFFVRVNETYMPVCVISGKIRQSGIKITIGDRVKIAVSPYNLQLGRIVFRLK